jgi:hypothetical protein
MRFFNFRATSKNGRKPVKSLLQKNRARPLNLEVLELRNGPTETVGAALSHYAILNAGSLMLPHDKDADALAWQKRDLFAVDPAPSPAYIATNDVDWEPEVTSHGYVPPPAAEMSTDVIVGQPAIEPQDRLAADPNLNQRLTDNLGDLATDPKPQSGGGGGGLTGQQANDGGGGSSSSNPSPSRTDAPAPATPLGSLAANGSSRPRSPAAARHGLALCRISRAGRRPPQRRRRR